MNPELMGESHADIPDENRKGPKDGLPFGPWNYLDYFLLRLLPPHVPVLARYERDPVSLNAFIAFLPNLSALAAQ